MARPKISPCLWFDHQAEESAKFYVSVFPNSEIKQVVHYGNAGREIHGRAPGGVMLVEFVLDGQKYTALNGGPRFRFTEAISLIIQCEDQQEIDYYWTKLSHVKEAEQCGWLKDKYGLSWQVVPAIISNLMSDSDPARADKVMAASLQMKKPDIRKLQEAFDSAPEVSL